MTDHNLDTLLATLDATTRSAGAVTVTPASSPAGERTAPGRPPQS
jgi:hypothetical protein